MEFENYARRILLVIDCNFFEKWPVDTKQTARLLVTDVEMQQKAVTKRKSSQFNDKRFYFSNGTTSLPLSHSYLKDLNKYKEKKGQRIEKCFWLEKDNEGKLLNERLSVYRQSPIRYYLLNQKQNFKNQKLIF